MPATPRLRSPVLIALLLASAMVVANLFEPLTVDDVCHQYYARHVSEAPLAPYEFDIVWHQRGCSAWACMVAPVNSYYWAPGILLGDAVPEAWQPLVWHAWYLPMYWLFCYSLLSILRRWVRRGAGWLTAAIALGPFVLPGLNLLLDVPMLSLGFAGLALLLRAIERRGVADAVLGGVFWGLAFQLKYSAMAFFAPWLLVAVFRWRWREFAVGLATTVVVAGGIELLLSLSHGGGSYFGQQLTHAQARDWSGLVRGMFLQVGALAAPGALLALHGLRLPRWATPAAAAVYLVGLVLVAVGPEAAGKAAYLLVATTTWGAIMLLLLRLLWSGFGGLRGLRLSKPRALRVLLAGWVVAEIVSSFVLSPFPAARRVMVVALAFTVVAAWLCVRRPGGVARLRVVAVASALLGASIQAIDYLEGNAWVRAAHGTVDYMREHAPDADVYFTGGWGFEYYAPASGIPPFVCEQTVLRAGDYVACGSIDGEEGSWFWRYPAAEPDALDERFELVATLGFGSDALPLSTQMGYYSGRRPLERQQGPRYVVRMLRAKVDLHARDLEAWDDPHFGREGK